MAVIAKIVKSRVRNAVDTTANMPAIRVSAMPTNLVGLAGASSETLDDRSLIFTCRPISMSRHIETWIVPAYGKLTASSRVRCTYDEGKLIFCCRVMSDVEHIFIQGRPQIDLLVVVPWPQGGTPARWFAVKRGLRV